MRFGMLSALIVLCMAVLVTSTYEEKKKPQNMTIKGLDTKRETKIETTDKKENPDKK